MEEDALLASSSTWANRHKKHSTTTTEPPKSGQQRALSNHWERLERDFFRPICLDDVEDLRRQLKMVEELAKVRYEDEEHTSSLLRSLVMEEECKSSNCGSMNTNISSTLQQNIGSNGTPNCTPSKEDGARLSRKRPRPKGGLEMPEEQKDSQKELDASSCKVSLVDEEEEDEEEEEDGNTNDGLPPDDDLPSSCRLDKTPSLPTLVEVEDDEEDCHGEEEATGTTATSPSILDAAQHPPPTPKTPFITVVNGRIHEDEDFDVEMQRLFAQKAKLQEFLLEEIQKLLRYSRLACALPCPLGSQEGGKSTNSTDLATYELYRHLYQKRP